MVQDSSALPAHTLPPVLERLEDLAFNLRWTWDVATRRLFAYAAGSAAEDAVNPVATLRQLSPRRIEELAVDNTFVAELNHVVRDFDRELNGSHTWFDGLDYQGTAPLVAYFSAEFGLTEQLPIYSGGLGVLAGDHLKSASALGVPLVAIGLFYYDGYFHQAIARDGRQLDSDEENDPASMPLRLVRDVDGEPITIQVEAGERTILARAWLANVGRVSLYLLDTRLPENDPLDQEISSRLYGGDQDLRLRQEIMLGIGGYRLLHALQITPSVYHLNEGHSSFLSLERIRRTMDSQELTFTEALATVSSSTVFTTHTPVAAGHDYFSPELLKTYFQGYARAFDLEWQDLLSLGQADGADADAAFGMTELAMHTSSKRNGVSKLHGDVTRDMWHKLWPDLPVEQVPIGHVTNGVHMATWIAPDNAALFDTAGPSGWRALPTTFDDWQSLITLPAAQLWTTHLDQKARLITMARDRMRLQAKREGASEAEVAAVAKVLDPDALTIGFARRFTAYKRATLFLRDIDRLEALMTVTDRPVQFIFSGKAHPRDLQGQEFIQRIAEAGQREPFKGRLLFLEDYDMAIARRMVAGVDIWLNNPIRPQEASGTSGMKAAANGVLNFSILDGWWAEAWESARERDEPIGWVIDANYTYDTDDEQDEADAVRLYEVLEQEIIPTFFGRDADGVPLDWVERMKASIRCAISGFSGDRMVAEYTEGSYLPVAQRAGQG